MKPLLVQAIIKNYFDIIFDVNFFDYQLYNSVFQTMTNFPELKLYFQSFSDNLEDFVKEVLKKIDSLDISEKQLENAKSNVKNKFMYLSTTNGVGLGQYLLAKSIDQYYIDYGVESELKKQQ